MIKEKNKYNINKKKIDAEREKGAPPPDYMPAIFGWMSLEEQEEHAKEIVDFTKKINKKEKEGN